MDVIAPECHGKCAQLVRFILLTRGFDACQDRQPEKYDAAHYDPALGNMQDDSTIDQPADHDQESNDVKAE